MSLAKRLVTETGEVSKQRTVLTSEEYDGLLTFMEEHPKLAKGTNRGVKASQSLNLWKVLAERMKMKGFVKDAKRWARYWSEWKYRVRRKALEIKAAKEQNSSINIKPFTPLEERILNLISDQAMEEFTIKTDPLGELTDEEPGSNVFDDDNIPANQDNGCARAATRIKNSRKRRHSSRDSDSEDAVSLPEVKPSTSDNGGEGTDEKDEAAAFLDLERQKLETTKQLLKAVESVAAEAKEIVNVLTQIKDAFISRNPNI